MYKACKVNIQVVIVIDTVKKEVLQWFFGFRVDQY